MSCLTYLGGIITLSNLTRPRITWIQWLAFGFGVGTAPKAPGTMGTLAALLALPVFVGLPLWVQLLWVVVTAVLGIWLCDRAAKELGVHDHPAIVWDEFVGLWIVFLAVPLSWATVLVGFILFRFFDIVKPWPIRWLDRRVKGGFGIMIDDIIAGIFAAVLMHVALALGWF